MTDNHLFQLAQVISDLPPSPTPPPSDRFILPLRKNACAICAICFTCSKNYAEDCTCEESQPRRGKNLPLGGLDSRAKKLLHTDKEDYDFTIQWLQQYANTVYRDPSSNQVVGLANQTEVGLCKAHSSTLYRARKRLEQQQQQQDYQQRSRSSKSPPSPVDFVALPLNKNNNDTCILPPRRANIGGLAAKVKELSQQQQQQQRYTPSDLDLRPSTSYKRKRMGNSTILSSNLTPSGPTMLPYSSASTPLYSSAHINPTSPSESISSSSVPHLSPQLPPLKQHQHQHQQEHSPVASSLTSLSSSLQQQLQLSSSGMPSKHHHAQYYHHHHHHQRVASPPPSPSYNLHHHSLQPQQHHHHHHHHNSTTTLSITSVAPLTSQFPVQPFTSSLSASASTPSIPSASPLALASTPSSASSSSSHSQSSGLHQQQLQERSPKPSSALPPIQPIKIDTVSLKSMPSNNDDSDESSIYFIRNLAITDTFTFRHLLEETDINGAPPPPPGKRLIIADPTSERIFPLSQAIRSVLPHPSSSHMEFCLGLTNKTPINWNT